MKRHAFVVALVAAAAVLAAGCNNDFRDCTDVDASAAEALPGLLSETGLYADIAADVVVDEAIEFIKSMLKTHGDSYVVDIKKLEEASGVGVVPIRVSLRQVRAGIARGGGGSRARRRGRRRLMRERGSVVANRIVERSLRITRTDSSP